MSRSSSRPLITTIIPTYRRPEMLRRAVRSVVNQTYPHLQVCIYDNASGDETASVVAEMAKADHRIKYHRHAGNIGAVRNFAYGLERVDTPFFSFLSDDDVLLPEFFETAMQGFKNHPDAAFFSGSSIAITDRGEVLTVPLSHWPREGYYTPPEGLLRMLGGRHPAWTAVIFRREVIDYTGGLDLDVGAPVDLDFELRIAIRFPFVISKQPCGIFVRHESSFCATTDYRFVWPGWLKMIRNLAEDERVAPDVRELVEQQLIGDMKRLLFTLGFLSIEQKNFKGGRITGEILRNYDQPRAAILSSAALLSEHFPPFYYCLAGLFYMYRSYKRYKLRDLQRQFGEYRRYLEM